MDALPGYTPLRRRPHCEYGNFSPANSQVPWTTARCNRLLRPIVSRLSLLRKDIFTKATGSITETPSSGPVFKPRKVNISNVRSAHPVSNVDPEWVPGSVIRRRVKHKYSGRSTGCKAQLPKDVEVKGSCALPGEVTIATPIITRNTRHSGVVTQEAGKISPRNREWDNGECTAGGKKRRRVQRASSKSCEGEPMPQDMRQKLKKVVAPSRWMLIDGLYNGLDTLLRGTARPTRCGISGSRSLFSVCVRKIPDYIAAEQAWHELQDDEDDVDVSSEVYNELENMGSTGIEGWKPLREVVRAHGVAMLSNAIREGLIDHFVGRGLVIICIHASAFDEAEALLESLVSTLSHIFRPARVESVFLDSDDTACLTTLDLFARKSGRFGFQYRQIEGLLRDRTLPIEWVATAGLAPIWGRLVQSISHVGNEYADAAKLLITAATLACGAHHSSVSSAIHQLRCSSITGVWASVAGPAIPTIDRFGNVLDADAGFTCALNNTVSSLMAILYAIDIIQREHSVELPNSQTYAFALLKQLNADILRAFELPSSTLGADRTSAISRRRTVTVLMVMFLSLRERQINNGSTSAPEPTSISEVTAAVARLADDNVPDAASWVAALVAGIARCCARASTGQEFDYIQKLTQNVASVAKERSYSTQLRHQFACFASTAAMEYAEKTGKALHIQWALGMEEDVMKHRRASARSIVQTPHKRAVDQSQGYRWEEGICEWIAKTPTVNVEDHTSTMQPSMPSDDTEQSAESQRCQVAPFVGIPFCLSREIPMDNKRASRPSSARSSNHGVTHQEKPSDNHFLINFNLSATKHEDLERPSSRKRRRCSLRRDSMTARHDSVWKVHVDNDDDELSTTESSSERVRPKKLKVSTSKLALTCSFGGEGLRQALRPTSSQSVRTQHCLRQTKTARLSLDDESEDELCI